MLEHLPKVALLTYGKFRVVCRLIAIQLNKPVVFEGRVLPMGPRLGIISLTLVVERVSKGSTVTRGPFVMIFFKIKTKLQYQIEEYISYKEKFSYWSALEHKKVLNDFVSRFNYTNISQIIIGDIQEVYNDIRINATPYTAKKFMQAMRGFFRYFHANKVECLNPRLLEDGGVINLTDVGNSVIIPMMKRQKPGKRVNEELVRKVKFLKDQGNLSFRQIAKALRKDVKNVYTWYSCYPLVK
jgi:hypothetical protein